MDLFKGAAYNENDNPICDVLGIRNFIVQELVQTYNHYTGYKSSASGVNFFSPLFAASPILYLFGWSCTKRMC